MTFDFIIIGSGMAGLACGIILAKEGRSVCILEKNPEAGGNLQSFERDGHRFSTGLHYVGSLEEGQPLHRFFHYLDILPGLKLKQLDRDGYDRIAFGEEETEYSHAQGWDHFIGILSGQFPDEKEAIGKYAGAVLGMVRQTPIYDFRAAESFKLDTRLLHQSTMEFLGSITSNRRLQHVLAGANSVYHGAAGRTPLYLHSCIRNSFVSSAWKIRGGSSHLTEVLLDSFRKARGELITDAEVTGFEVENGKLSGARLADGRKFSGMQFISGIHPAATLQLEGLESIRPAYRKRIESLENSAGFFSLYLIFKDNFFPYLDYNFFQYYDDEYFSDKLEEKDWPHTYLVYTPFEESASGFTKTASILSFLKNRECSRWMGLPPEQRGQDYLDFRESRAEKLLDAIEKRFPGIRQGIEKYYISTPVTFRDFTGSPEGSGYGILKDCNDPVRSIIQPRTRIPNLFLTGQNLNIHGILGTTTSAFVTCSEIIGYKNLVSKLIHD